MHKLYNMIKNAGSGARESQGFPFTFKVGIANAPTGKKANDGSCSFTIKNNTIHTLQATARQFNKQTRVHANGHRQRSEIRKFGDIIRMSYYLINDKQFFLCE